MEAFSTLTSADVAASDDVTGHEQLGGDWELEQSIGQIETDIPFSDAVLNDWQWTLDTTTGLVAHYEFEEGSGTQAFDSSVNSNTGTLINSPSWAAGVIGSSAINFSGDFDASKSLTTRHWILELGISAFHFGSIARRPPLLWRD